MQSVSKEQFSEIIGQSQKLVVVDCGAAWCGPCKKLTPILEELGVSMGEKIDVVYVDVGEQPALAREHGVMSLPTVLFFRTVKFWIESSDWWARTRSLKRSTRLLDYLGDLIILL